MRRLLETITSRVYTKDIEEMKSFATHYHHIT